MSDEEAPRGRGPLHRRAYGLFICRPRILYTGLLAAGVSCLAASYLFDLWFLAFGVAFLLPGFVGLVMAGTTAGIGEEIKNIIVEKADETMGVIRETSSKQVEILNDIRDSQNGMVETQNGMANTLTEIKDSQNGMANTLTEIKDLLEKNQVGPKP